ncbi:RidA family protein [Aminobacter sp. SR38]|jgi:enamine deaminase RidA (YjgF/YER057c/UK114 family)|uniref:Rid family hydrolase n=1 Tax=Aminobacter sp. SR38 TaxID=2774562 RepID=UPI0017802346|nr:Rid family hydrolase [Aminobacter sp. SR38]QOF73366.1 RidA family protein [Aminobacter sp. SR38]
MSSKQTSKRQNISSGGAYENIFGYSRAVRVGKDIHVSGTCAPAGHEDSDAYIQTRAALSIIEKALADAGAGLEHVVRTVVYIRDIADAEAVARGHLISFDSIRPASTLIQVSSMLRSWQKVEIEAYAKLST